MSRQLSFYAFGALLIAANVAVIVRIFDFSADDALIVARYAEHLVEGVGLAYNPEERINALTSPLHALIEAALYAATGSSLGAHKLLSVVLIWIAAALVVRSARERAREQWLFAALVVVCPFIAIWVVGGLETPYLLFCCTWLVLLVRQSDEELSPRRALGISVLMGACFLLRFDSALFLAPLGLFLLLRHRRRAVLLVLPAAAMALGWLAFAHHYFHDFFPTSFYRKAPSADAASIFRNAAYVAQFFVLSGLAVVVVDSVARLRGTPSAGRALLGRARREWWLWAAIGAEVGYACLVARSHMMFSGRILVPYLPAIALAVMRLGAADDTDSAAATERRPPWLAAATLLALHGATTWMLINKTVNIGWMGEYQRESLDSYASNFSRVLRASGRDIRAHWEKQTDTSREHPIIYTFAGGILPYEYKEATALNGLVSLRKNCRADRRAMANYVHLLTPRHVKPDELPTHLELVTSYTFPFDGRNEETSMVYFQKQASENTLPAHVDEPCRTKSQR